jgi:S-methylmethionine-dependent homocysteine/selenocysteine methylase
MTITILDGGMSRELQKLGAPFRQPEWSALPLMETPQLVAEVHDLFAAAGADVITTNSYAIVPFHIGHERFASEGAMLARRAGELARSVADRRGIEVAASLPPVMGSYRPDLFNVAEATPILQVLIENLSPFADIWLAETQSSLAEVTLVRELLGADPRPLWLSFTLEDVRADDVLAGKRRPALRSGESIEEAARLALKLGASALLFNCSQPEVMEAAVREAKAVLGDSPVRIGVYANAFASEADDEEANETIHDIRADLDPPRYLTWAKSWVDAGASMVGGCCGISPAHIAELNRALK